MTLEECRELIDGIDRELVGLLRTRLSVSEKVAEYKIANGLPTYDKTREDALLSRISEMAGSDREAILVIYRAILETSRARQELLRGGTENG